MEKILRWSILVLLFLTPLLSPERLPFFNIVFPAVILILFVFFVIIWFSGKKQPFIGSKPVLPLIILSLAVLLSALFSGIAAFNIFDLKILFVSLLLIITANSFKTPEDRKKAAFIIMAGALLTALFAFYQRIFGMDDLAKYMSLHGDPIKDPRIYAEFMKNIAAGRIFSTFVNSNVFAGFLAMALPVTLGLFLADHKNKLMRAGTGISFLILLAALLLTRSAGGAVAAVTALAVFLFFVVKEKKKLVFACLSLTVIFALGILLLRPDIFNFAKEDNSILNRLAYFKEALSIFMKDPLLGAGSNSYARFAAGGIKYPHNWYLQVLAENGLLGLGLLLVFLGIMVKEGLGTLRGLKGTEKIIFAGFFAGFTGFLVHNFFDVDSNYWQNCLTAFFLAGLTASRFKTGFKNYFLILIALAMGSAVLFSRQEYVSLLLFSAASGILFLKVFLNRDRFVKTALDIPLVLLILLSLVSLVFSVNRFVTLQSVCLIMFCAMVFYSAVNSIKTARDFKPAAYFIACLCLVLSLTGILEYYYFGGQRSFGLFTNPNILGGFLASGFGFLLFYIIKEKGRNRLLFGLASIASLYCLILTKSRGGLLVAACSIILFIIFLNVLARKKAVPEKTRKYVTIGLLLFLAVAVTPLNPIVKRAGEIGINDEAAYSRTKIWASSVKLFRDRPLTGFGLNTYKDVAPKYYFPVGGSIGRFTRVQHQAHNEYLQFLAETGIAGGLLVLVFIFFIARRFLSVIRNLKDKEKLFIACAVFTALTGFLVHALVDFNLHFLPSLLMFVLLTGVLFSEYLSAEDYFVTEKKKKIIFTGCAAVVTAVFLILTLMNFCSEYFLARKGADALTLEKNLKLSLFFSPFHSESYAELGKLYRYEYRITKNSQFMVQAEEYFKQAQKKNPASAHYHKHLGLLYYVAGLKNEVFSEYETAIKLNPYDVFLKFELAYLYSENGNYEPALKYSREAIKLEPNFVGAHMLLSGLYTKLNKVKAAEYERKQALEINARYKNLAVIDYEKMLISIGKFK